MSKGQPLKLTPEIRGRRWLEDVKVNGGPLEREFAAAILAELAREREARESETRERFQAAYAKANIAEALRQRDEAEGRVRKLEEALRQGATIAEEYDCEGEVSGHVLVEVPLVWLRALREVLRGGLPEVVPGSAAAGEPDKLDPVPGFDARGGLPERQP